MRACVIRIFDAASRVNRRNPLCASLTARPACTRVNAIAAFSMSLRAAGIPLALPSVRDPSTTSAPVVSRTCASISTTPGDAARLHRT